MGVDRVQASPGAPCEAARGEEAPASITVAGKADSFVPSNRIDVSAAWACEHGFLNRELVHVERADDSRSAECCLVIAASDEDEDSDSDAARDTAKTTLRVMEQLGIGAGDRVCISVRKHEGTLLVKHVAVQRIDKVREGCVALSEDLYRELEVIEGRFSSKRRHYYRLNHLATGALCYIPFDKIELDEDLAPETMRLSRYQRTLLNLSVPPCTLNEATRRLIARADVDPETKRRIAACYDRAPQFVPESYEEQKTIRRDLRECGYDAVQITASAFDEPAHLVSKIPKAVSGFMVGNSSILLKSCRPYDNDEGRDIVRLSRSAMVHLGIDESDKVILRHGKAKAKARALSIDSLERIRETNTIAREADIDPIVGIPAFMRRDLGVCDLDEAVLVERDTGYLFTKNLNAQFMPMILFFLAVIQTGFLFGSVVLGYVLSVSIVGLPIIAFIVFSEQRAKVK